MQWAWVSGVVLVLGLLRYYVLADLITRLIVVALKANVIFEELTASAAGAPAVD